MQNETCTIGVGTGTLDTGQGFLYHMPVSGFVLVSTPGLYKVEVFLCSKPEYLVQ